MQGTLLKAENIAKSFVMGEQKINVLTDASISVRRGEFVTIVGSSGCGKSTFLHILGGLDIPDGGEVTIEGESIHHSTFARRDAIRNQKIGFIFQFYHLLPELTVLENTMLPAMVTYSMFQWLGARAAVRERALSLLDRVGLSERLNHRPNKLSGGERQRVAIARAMINDPPLLLADEPTGNLDRATGASILDVFDELNRAGQTIIMVTHDPVIGGLADVSYELTNGELHAAEIADVKVQT
jgi:lipoprotein-releasing system ATP-binding protein